MLQPACDISHILEIHDCIDELKRPENLQLHPILVAILKNFHYVDRLHKLTMVVPQDDNIRVAEILIHQTLYLKRCLQLVPTLRAKLELLRSKKFREIFEALNDSRYETMLNQINTVINPELVTVRSDSSGQLFQFVYCVRNGANSLVDLLRGKYTELLNEIQGKHWINKSSQFTVCFGIHLRTHYEFVGEIRPGIQN